MILLLKKIEQASRYQGITDRRSNFCQETLEKKTIFLKKRERNERKEGESRGSEEGRKEGKSVWRHQRAAKTKAKKGEVAEKSVGILLVCFPEGIKRF